MVKLVEVTACYQCPCCIMDHQHTYRYMNESVGKVIDDADTIPNWCLLPDMPKNTENDKT